MCRQGVSAIADATDGSSDDAELWFSDEEHAEKNGQDEPAAFACSSYNILGRAAAAPSEVSAEELAHILAKLELAKKDVAAIYLLGPHLWGCATQTSSWKLLIVIQQAAGPSKQRRNGTEAGSLELCRREHRQCFLETSRKRSGKRTGIFVKATVETVAQFQRRLQQHRGLLPVWLPAEHIWLEEHCLQTARQSFRVDRQKLLKVVSAHYTSVVKRLDKFSRKQEWSKVRQVTLKLLRVLLLSRQIARMGRIINYSCQPELGRAADGFDGPEIMPLCDLREDRLNDHADDSGVVSVATYEGGRLQFQWRGVVEPLMEGIRAACLAQPVVCMESEGESHGIPKAVSTAEVQRLCVQHPPSDVVVKLEALLGQYASLLRSLLAVSSMLGWRVIRISHALQATNSPSELAKLIGTKAMLKATSSSLVFLRDQVRASEAGLACAHGLSFKLFQAPQSVFCWHSGRRTCMIDFLINRDDVRKHTADRSIPDYYIDLVQYLGEDRSDARAYPVWMDKESEERLCFSRSTDIFYKHMGSATFFEKSRNFERGKFRRNQAVSAMTAPFTKKDGLARILRESCGDSCGSHPADAQACGVAIAATSERCVLEVSFQPGQIGLSRRGHQVVAVVEGSQAHKRGVKPGWVIDSIDGEPYSATLLKAKKDGEDAYIVGFVEVSGRVAAVAADNIAPRSFTVGISGSTHGAYNDVASFEEEYVRGLAVAVCRRMLAALRTTVEADPGNGGDSGHVRAPFDLDVARAALAVLRFTNSRHGPRIYCRILPESVVEDSTEEHVAYSSALRLLLQHLFATPLKQYSDPSAWKCRLPHGSLTELELAAVLDDVAAWDPQMKTLYGADNLWILKPKGMGRGKGIFVAECAHDITRTSGLDHLFKAARLAHEYDAPQLPLAGAPPVLLEEQMRLGGYGLERQETDWVAQKYIEKPLLFQGRKKFDIRFMTLVSFVGNDQLEATPAAPGPGASDLPWAQAVSGGAHAGGRLACYAFEDSVMKVCTGDFHDDEAAGELRHLTNHAVQEHHPLYDPKVGIQDSAVACAHGSLGQSAPVLAGVAMSPGCERRRVDRPEDIYDQVLLPQMQALAYRVFSATPWEKDWARDEGFYPTDVRFQLFGFDMMVDEDYRVWVIEVNQQPGLSAEGVPAMTRIMRRLLRGMFGVLLDVERYDLICSSRSDGQSVGVAPPPLAQGWPQTAAGWRPLAP